MSITTKIPSRIRQASAIVFHGPFDDSTEMGRSNERLRRIGITAIASMCSRALSMAFPIVTIPLILSYLGEEIYGLWGTVVAFFAILPQADFGLGNSLITLLSRSLAQGNRRVGQELVSFTFFFIAKMAFVILLFFLLLYPFIPWSKILNAVSPDTIRLAGTIILLVFLPNLLQIPFAIVQKAQLAFQEGYWGYFWQCIAYLLNFAAVALLIYFNAGKCWLIGTIAAIPALFCILNWLLFFGITKREYIPRWSLRHNDHAKRITKMGMSYFFLSMLLISNTAFDGFLIAHIQSLQAVTPFLIASRIAMLLSVTLSMLCMPMWSANSEAIARGDHSWVHRITHRMVLLSLCISGLGGLCLVIAGPWGFAFWLRESLPISRLFLLGLACREILLATSAPYFMILNGIGDVKSQIKIYVLFIPISLVLKAILIYWAGIAGAAWGMAIAYGFLVCPYIYRRSQQHLRETQPV